MKQHVIQYDDGLRPIYAKCIEQARSRIPESVEYTLVQHTDCKARCQDFRAVSDVLRLRMASERPDMVWLDSDVLIKKWPDFEFKKGRPYLNDRTASVIFVNGCTELFKNLWNLYEIDMDLNYPGWLQYLVKEYKDEFEYLPAGYFVHCCLSQAIQAGENFSNYGTSDFRITKEENGQLNLKVFF